MLEQALKKVRDEMEKEKGNSFINLIGQYLIEMINSTLDIAPMVLAEDKTIKGFYQFMESAARKKVVGNMAVISPAEAFKLLEEYYGLPQGIEHKEPVINSPAEKEETSKADTEIKLSIDDYLNF